MTTSTILCDSDRCESRIVVSGDIDETQAAAVARAAGWFAQLGASRFYHHCEKHKPVKR